MFCVWQKVPDQKYTVFSRPHEVSFLALQECTRVSAKLGENRMWQRTVTRGLAVSTGALVDKLRI